jgi:predicted nucleic acid-binding protein
MIDAVLDTTVTVHLFRNYQPAISWFNNQQRYGITSISWLEIMGGASNKAKSPRV